MTLLVLFGCVSKFILPHIVGKVNFCNIASGLFTQKTPHLRYIDTNFHNQHNSITFELISAQTDQAKEAPQ